MKTSFLRLLMTAIVEAATGGTTAAVVEILTSPKLTDLEAQAEAAWNESLKHKFGTPEAKAAKMLIWKIDGEIEAEKQAIRNAKKAAEIAEAKNKRLALNSNQLTAYAELLKVQADKKATPEAIADAQSKFDTAKELVDNELLAKYAGTKPAKAAKADGEATESKTSENKAAILDLYRAGKKHAEIEAAGFARSTVWHVINNAIKAGEVEKLH